MHGYGYDYMTSPNETFRGWSRHRNSLIDVTEICINGAREMREERRGFAEEGGSDICARSRNRARTFRIDPGLMKEEGPGRDGLDGPACLPAGDRTGWSCRD